MGYCWSIWNPTSKEEAKDILSYISNGTDVMKEIENAKFPTVVIKLESKDDNENPFLKFQIYASKLQQLNGRKLDPQQEEMKKEVEKKLESLGNKIKVAQIYGWKENGSYFRREY